MRVFHDIEALDLVKPVATLGIFDGVHLAHQSVIKKLRETADVLFGESTIITLWPHPRIVLNGEKDQIKLLNTLEEKIERLEKTGIENLIIIPFDKKLASMGFDQFIREILLKKIGITHLVVGYNHQFGHNREGDFQRLRSLADELNFGLSMQEPVRIEETRISSSLIRRLILEGNMEQANNFLGYTFFISGEVIGGNKMGRGIGFPTANIEVREVEKIIPPRGVYAVYAKTEGSLHKGMMNIGCRPTLNENCLQDILEVNLFDFEEDLYKKKLKIYFIKKLREERKFVNIAALRHEIEKDKHLINEILDSIKIDK